MADPALTEAAVRAALEEVKDPDLGQSIVAMGLVREIRIAEDASALSLTCELTTPACPAKEQIEGDIRRALAKHFPHIKRPDVKMSGKVRGAVLDRNGGENLLPRIKNVVLVASGKGGVGKSTVAVNLALALHRKGARSALLDLDIFNPAAPLLLELQRKPQLHGEHKIEPLRAHGIEVMGMGFLVDARQALPWRGTVVDGLVVQFLKDVLWSEADYMIVDLPPGGAEVLLAITRHCPVAGAVLVRTPRKISRAAAVRTRALLGQLHIPVLGLIENMSGFPRGARGEAQPVFENSEARTTAEELDLPLLGRIPFEHGTRADGGHGAPMLANHPATPAARAFLAAAEHLAAQVSIRNLGGEAVAASGAHGTLKQAH